MSRRHHTLTTLALGGVLALGLTACSDAASPLDDSEFTPSLTNDIGAGQADEIDAAMGTFQFESSPPPFVAGGEAAIIAPVYRPRFGGCATVDDLADTDGDGTPDDATFTYALPACHFTSFRGGTLDVTGAVELSDPTPTSADWAAHLALDDFRLEHTNPLQTRSYATTRNGSRTLTVLATTATLTNNVSTVRSATGFPDATISHNLQLTFAADAELTIVRGEPLPSGHFQISGSLTWVRGLRSRSFTVTTVVPLRWDASCGSDRKITEGEVHWTLENGNYIKTVWTGCGVDPTRTFVRVN